MRENSVPVNLILLCICVFNFVYLDLVAESFEHTCKKTEVGSLEPDPHQPSEWQLYEYNRLLN